MVEKLFGTEVQITPVDMNEMVSLPEALQKWFVYPDEWSSKQEALEMENELLLAEREEVVQYVRILKKLAVYLAEKTDVSTETLFETFFFKAEINLPDYLREELEVASLN
jgi:hypothetical protein